MTQIPGLKPHHDWLPNQIIFATKHGSHAFGTNIESSDLDIKGVAIPTYEYFLGFNVSFEQHEQHDPDIVIYDIRKFMRLACDANPSILEVLFTDKSDHIIDTFYGRVLLAARDHFLSKKVRGSYMGYAMGQLKRIRTHRGWLLHPPKKKPNRADYGLPEHQAVADKEQIRAAEHLNEKGYGYGTNFQELVAAEKRFRVDQAQWEQYENWKKTRNPARSELEAKFGYDTKHGMHLVRLVRMCKEILSGGQVLVKRPDAKELLEIRNGAWSYEKLIEWAEAEEKEINSIYESSRLPEDADRDHLSKVCATIVRSVM